MLSATIVGPPPNRNGMTGTIAPIANATNDPPAARHGDPSWSGIEPELLADQRVERLLRIGEQPLRDRLASAGAKPLAR